MTTHSMHTFLTRALQSVAFLALLAALGMTIGMVGEELGDRAAAVTADAQRADTDYPAATPDACQTEALRTARSRLPDLGIEWRWADLERAVGTALLRSRIAMLDPVLDCADVPVVAYHEWTHIATTDYYGGPEMLTGAVVGKQIDPTTKRPFVTDIHEVVADCAGALLAGKFGDRAVYNPYMDRADGCAPGTMALVHEILAHAGVRLPADPVALGVIGSGVA